MVIDLIRQSIETISEETNTHEDVRKGAKDIMFDTMATVLYISKESPLEILHMGVDNLIRVKTPDGVCAIMRSDLRTITGKNPIYSFEYKGFNYIKAGESIFKTEEYAEDYTILEDSKGATVAVHYSRCDDLPEYLIEAILFMCPSK